MEEPTFDALIGKQDAAQRSVGAGKILVQCLDISGSMSGGPIQALKLGA